ncbi:MAG: hypothetical protein Q9195_001033 [Heterodermia aff. obscurata]
MAKEKSADKEQRKNEKKASKEKRSETEGIHKSKKDKKEKKEKRAAAAAADIEATTKLLNAVEEEKPGSVVIKEDGELQVKIKSVSLLGALVPFANPLADEKAGKKVLKSVKKAAKSKALKRGVKEVVKALRKSPTTVSGDLPFAIVVIAADISPMDVISHIPVLCEDHSVPYIFVPSRTELGAASSTKRPTSVTMINKDMGGKKKDAEREEEEEDWGNVYKDLVKVVTRASKDVRI